MSKAGAEVVLKSLLGREIDVDNLPWGPEEALPAGIETVVFAPMVRPRRGVRIDEVEVHRGNGIEKRVVGGMYEDEDGIVRIKEEVVDE
ncbi:ATP-dependent 3'-5' DNA helicase [Oleoguttula sp. CCFEE 5521]